MRGPLVGLAGSMRRGLARFCHPKVIASSNSFANMSDQKVLDSNLRCKDASSQRACNNNEYKLAIDDLNNLQSNTQSIALAKYKEPEKILPLFKKQLELAGISLSQLEKLNVVHVTGTKGKGSTCMFLESILRAHGLKVGFYNSPHLLHVTERIRLDGRPISQELFCKYFREVYDRLKVACDNNDDVTMPSYFSFLTILAFEVYLREQVDCAIIEVGIGGEFDPTNIVPEPLACAITTLDLDHTNILGNKIEQIAWTKSGIAKRGSILYTIEHEQPRVGDVIKSRAKQVGCEYRICPAVKEDEFVKLGIEGDAQRINAALACQLAARVIYGPEVEMDSHWTKLPERFREALSSCRWAGRCQVLERQNATFFLDGAHTAKSMGNCIKWFENASRKRLQSATKILMVNIIGDRNKREILKPLATFDAFDLVIFSTNRVSPRLDSLSSDNTAVLQERTGDRSLENAYDNANEWRGLLQGREKPIEVVASTDEAVQLVSQRFGIEHEVHVLCTGSLHFVGAVLESLGYEIE